MDLDRAISSHTSWKIRLLRYMDKPDGSINANAIENHHACELGGWIYGPASKYKNLPEYQQLLTDHTAFHKQASIIVQKINDGELVTHNDLTHPDSPYAIASQNVVGAILSLKRKIGPAAIEAGGSGAVKTPAVHTQAPSFLTISKASPAIMSVIMRNTSHCASEIASIYESYTNTTLPAVLVDMIRESLLISGSDMLIQILEASKKHAVSSHDTPS